jgi:hypothetical protein
MTMIHQILIATLISTWFADTLLLAQEKFNIEPLILNKVVKPDMIFGDHAPFWQNGYSAIFCTGPLD